MKTRRNKQRWWRQTGKEDDEEVDTFLIPATLRQVAPSQSATLILNPTD